MHHDAALHKRGMMNRILRQGILAIAVIVVAWCAFHPGQSEAEETVQVAWDEWAPFHSQTLPHKGLYSHLISKAFATVGVTVEHVVVPWKRAYMEVREGEIDMSTGWMKTPEREVEVLYSDPLPEACVVYFHRKETAFEWATEEDLAGWKIGATLGYRQETVLKAIQEKGINVTVDIAAKDLSSIKKLFLGRIDVFASGQKVGEALLREYFSPEEAESITFHKKPMYCDAHHAIFSRKTSDKSKRLISLLNEGLKKLHNTGRYAELLEAFRNGAYEKQ